MAEENVFQLVKALCDSVSVVKEEQQEESKASFGMDLSISYDKTLAELFDMGYDIELASRAIRDCGRLDVAAIIDHMNEGAPTSIAAALGSSAMASKVLNSTTLAPLDVKVKVDKEGQQHISNYETGPSLSRTCLFEASTSRANASQHDLKAEEEEEEDDKEHRFRSHRSRSSLTVLEPLGNVDKGKTPVAPAVVAGEDLVDSNRWEYDDDEGTDKESTLLRMGFCQENVTDALQRCGEESDVNHLANYIMNNIVDFPANDSTGEDYDSVGEEDADLDGMKEGLTDGPGKELTDQELQIYKKLQSMGFSFSVKMVSDAISACGKEASEDALVDYLLRTDEQKEHTGTSSENGSMDLQKMSKVQQLRALGSYSTAACLRAIDSNRDAHIYELLDYLDAEKLNDELTQGDQQRIDTDDDEYGCPPPRKSSKRRKTTTPSKVPRKEKTLEKQKLEKQQLESSPEPEYHRNLKGFGLPGEPVITRELSAEISQPPYFYFENVASMPKDEWRNIQRHLYNIAPEFVDSLNFAPCRRPRGYIHNLPLEGRVDILPRLPRTVQELIPGSAAFWPRWDPRVKLNTINTRTASEFVRRQIQESVTAIEKGDPAAPSPHHIKTIMFWAKKWNLVWIRPGVLAPLCPEEVETCLGFDPNHTRVLYSPVDRVRVLGNTFQVNTVAYHLSVLRPLYQSGIRVLSLFSGIGGAEVALHKLGIFLRVVVSVEIDDKARMVVDSWWKTTNQKGRLIHNFQDVRQLDSKVIQKMVDDFGGFDLIIGGSPCNNLSGNNRCSRVGLAGPASVTFFEFPRILSDVRDFMQRRR